MVCQEKRSKRDGRSKTEDRTLIIVPKDKDYSFYKICFKKENCTEIRE